MTKLNLACGKSRISGALNVDMSPDVGADAVFDIRKPFPLAQNAYEEVYFFHAVEHLEKRYHGFVLNEIWDKMILGGRLIISYPEFENILKNWLDNKGNDRAFWEATLYGRQAYPGDYHVSAINTPHLRELMFEVGFRVDAFYPEPNQDFNTVMICTKVDRNKTYEDLVKEEIFGDN